jgi:hypothetical protein
VSLTTEASYAARLITAAGTNSDAVFTRLLQEIAATNDYDLLGGIIYNLARSGANSIKKVDPEDWQKKVRHSFHGKGS